MKLTHLFASALFVLGMTSVGHAARLPCEDLPCTPKPRPPVTCAAVADFRGKTCSYVAANDCSECGSNATACAVNFAPTGIANGFACVYCAAGTAL